MDGPRFDDLLRSLTESRRSLLGGSLAAVAGLFGFAAADAKKKRKKACASKCKNGCCTRKFGKCIQSAQQTAQQCGTGGEICRTNCGGGVACGAGCATCCAGGACIDAAQISNEQCGVGGAECAPCPSGQICNAPSEGCCAPIGQTCGSANDCCTSGGGLLCENSTCCVPTATTAGGAFCSETADCCDDDDVCDAGQCRRKEGASCQPGNLLCQSPLGCIGGTCSACSAGEVACGNSCCNGYCCDGNCCPGNKCCQTIGVCCQDPVGDCCS